MFCELQHVTLDQDRGELGSTISRLLNVCFDGTRTDCNFDVADLRPRHRQLVMTDNACVVPTRAG